MAASSRLFANLAVMGLRALRRLSLWQGITVGASGQLGQVRIFSNLR